MENQVNIVDYNDSYREAFKSLNQEWIERYFVMEEMDHKALDHPKEYILDNGGYIAVALLHNEPVGVCALIKMQHEHFDYELAKMGVSPKAQGLGIGYQLGLTIIDKAKEFGATYVYIESNTKLKPAINLYKKLGFVEVKGIETPYERCDIQLELKL